MKILLDENIDVRFKKLFLPGYEVVTISDMKWNGVKNGALLKLLQEHNFDCWIVVDKNIPYQQNQAKLPCTILILDVVRNTLKHIAPLVVQIQDRLSERAGKEIIIISGS
jgi:hypothetical protein